MVHVIAVFDAWGPIGRSVIDALSGEFQVKALTREESVTGPRNDQETVTNTVNYHNQASLETALDGVDACFVITKYDFNDRQSVQNEVKQGKMISLACSRTGVRHVVYSTQLSVSSITGIPARHMDAKTEVERSFREHNIPLTCLIIPCCYEMLLVEPLRPKRIEPGQFAIGKYSIMFSLFQRI